MQNIMNKREFLTAGVGAGLVLGGRAAFGQQASAAALRTGSAAPSRRVPSRIAKTTKLFKSPGGFPNGIAVAPEGLWIAEQKLSGAQAASYHMAEPKDLSENAWLVDWNGKLLKTVKTPSRNTSGMAYGGGYIWMCANAPPQGVFQVDMNSKVVSHRQIPLGPANDGGGSHGALVPRVQVKAIQTNTGFVRTTSTGADGAYILNNLPVGPYRLEAAADGFKTHAHRGITLQLNTNPVIHIALAVGLADADG
jgi:hypothetical protein